MDKRNKNAIQNHRDDIVGKLGCLDIMVNNARIYHEAQEAKYSEQARETLDTNCYGTINVIKTFLRILGPFQRWERYLSMKSCINRTQTFENQNHS